jgi:RHS repeat-associated protein/uncharacterized repeat protein (TIGR01451 family)
VLCVVALLAPLWPARVAANDGEVGITLRKTVASTTFTPVLALGLTVDKPQAIPGDTLTYAVSLTNPGAVLGLGGKFTARSHGDAGTTVVYYWDELQGCAKPAEQDHEAKVAHGGLRAGSTNAEPGDEDECDNEDGNPHWKPLAGFVASQPNYQPLQPPVLATGMTLTATSLASPGVTYPATVDPILGTHIEAKAIGAWQYQATVPLTPAQIAVLADPHQVHRLRNVIHFEVMPATASEDRRFKGGDDEQNSRASTSAVGIANPVQAQANAGAATNVLVTITLPSGQTVPFSSSTTPALASLAPGATVTLTTPYKVPVVAAKGATETDFAYLARLTAINGSTLQATVAATGSGPSGPVTVLTPPTAATIEQVPIVRITKSGPAARDAGTVVTYQLALQNSGGVTAGALTVTDTLSNGGSGIVSSVPASLAPMAAATATASYAIPAAAPAGTLTNTAAVSWHDANADGYGPVSSSVPTRVTTTGVPPEVQPVASTTIHGNFFAEPPSAQTFVATTADTPAFGQDFPTINFNPPAGAVPHNISGVGPQTRPFTDVVTDLVGNFAGTIPAQGGGFQAGVAPMQSFDAVLQASFIVQAAGDVTFVVYHDDGFILGIGNGATRVSGIFVAPPSATAFAGYQVIGAFNQMVAAPRTDEVTVHFPAAGVYPYELDYFEAGADSLTLTLTTAPAPSGSTGSTVGGVFVTGHDPDYHAFQGGNKVGAQHIIQRAIATVTRGKANPTVLLVMDLRDPGRIQSDPRLGMIAAGFTAFDLADYGSGNAGALDLHTVRFASYDVVVVASDYGGWLRQDELDILNARAGEIAIYLNQGGGLVAFAESGNTGLTTHGQFGFLPCLNEISLNADESGFQLTPLGQAIGLVPTDVNGNAYHNVFSSPCGMDVVDFDPSGRPVSLTSTGVSRSWNIAHDFQLAPNQANPSNGGVWSYLQAGSNPLDPSGYTKLPTFTSQAYGMAGLQQWTGSFVSTSPQDLLPAAGVNASGASLHPTTFVWPNGVFRVHPWTPAVVVGWTSPFTGTVHVEGAVTHLDQSCGDGVRWNVLSGSTRLASGQVTFGASAGQFLSEGTGGASLNQISVTTGQSLYFVVDAGAQGNFSCDSTALDVTIVEGPAPVTRPLPPATTLLIQPASVGATVGQAVNLTVSAMDGTGAPVAGVPVSVTISGPNSTQFQVSTDAAGLAPISYVGAGAGTDQVAATADMGGRLSVSNAATVTWTVPGPNPSLAPPRISAPSPPDGTVVTKPTPISATFSPPPGETLTSWSVAYQPAEGGPVVTLQAGTGAPPSPLAIFDPTLLRNDTYLITISATTSGGGTQSLTTTLAVAGSLKLGRYVTTFHDLSVPVSGFQMAVLRTYDSTDTRNSDFGTHWRLSVSNITIMPNRQLGAGGWTEYPTRCIFGLCDYGFKTTTPHYVTVTFSDQQQETFDFTPSGGSGILYFQGSAAFTARPGTHSTLEALDAGLSNGFNGNLYGSSGIYNPTRFRLTTHSGQVLILDTGSGLVSITDRNGNSLTVDASGVHASNGASLAFTRDSQGRINRVTGPSGQVLSYVYTAAGNLASSTDPNGNATTYAYDASGRLSSITGATGSLLQTLEYDAAGRLVAVIDANGNRSPITNDVPGQKQTFTDPMALATRIDTFDDVGDLVRSDVVPTTGPTLTTTSTYDAEGRPTSRTDPGGITSRATYDAAGNAVQGIDALGRVLTYAYNANGDLLSVTAPDGTTPNQYSYDGSGNLLTVTRSDGSSVHMTYDAQGHPLTITDSLGNVTRYVYDAGGHAVEVTDPAGAASRFAVDASGRVTSATDPLGAVINFTYDAAGQLTAVTNAAGNRVTFTYDGLGRQVSTSDLSSRASTLTYDANGRVLSTLDQSGVTTTYEYDANGRMVRQAIGSQVITSSYDALGRPVQVQNESASVALTYDTAGRVAGETTSAVGGSGIPTTGMTYTYDAVGGRLSAIGPAGTTTYAYDSLERLTGVTDPAGGSFGITYDGLGRPVGLARPNGVSDSMSYDAAGHLASIQSRRAAGIAAASSYTLDQAGHRASVTDAGGAVTRYTHDTFGSLTAVATSVATVAYTYDTRGNRLSRGTTAYTYDAGDRMTSDGTFTYTYDAGGRMLTKTDATGAVTRYTWNGRGQLIGITLPSGSVVSYLYDPFGRRVAVNSAGVVTRYAYDGPNLTAEYDGSNNLVAGYTGLPTVDQQLEMTRGGQRYFYLRDGSNSVVALTDLAGATAASYSYDAFGVPGATTGSVSNPLRYTGREYDSSSGLYFYRARYYDPNSGRFLSEDPIRHLNPYPYAANDPVDFNDPSGALFIEYIALVADQFHRATAIGTFAACLGNLLYTGLKDFQGLSSATICRSLAHSLRDLAIGLLDNPFVDAAFGPHDLKHELAAAGAMYGTVGGAANELFTISGLDYQVFWDIHGFVATKGGVRATPGGPRILVVANERVYWKPFPGAGLIGTIVGTGLGAGLDAHDFLTVLLDPEHHVCE